MFQDLEKLLGPVAGAASKGFLEGLPERGGAGAALKGASVSWICMGRLFQAG